MDFPGDLVLILHASNAGGVCSIPDQGTKIPHTQSGNHLRFSEHTGGYSLAGVTALETGQFFSLQMNFETCQKSLLFLKYKVQNLLSC